MGFETLGITTTGYDEGSLIMPLSDFIARLSERKYMSLNRSITEACADNRDIYGHTSYMHADQERRRTYARWFWNINVCFSPFAIRDDYLRCQLMRFRMGAHRLEVVTGAWRKTKRPDRLCRCCNMGIVEDEVHLTFECLLYVDIRQKYGELFRDFIISNNGGQSIGIAISDTDNMMRHFYGQQNQEAVAKFVAACVNKRNEYFDQS